MQIICYSFISYKEEQLANMEAFEQEILRSPTNTTWPWRMTYHLMICQYTKKFLLPVRYGGGYFHVNIETVPRIFPYLQFLKRHPEIRIHSSSAYLKRYLSLLGVKPDRVLSGAMKADMIYFPMGWDVAHPVALQLVHHHYAEYIIPRIISQTNGNDNYTTLKHTLFNDTAKVVDDTKPQQRLNFHDTGKLNAIAKEHQVKFKSNIKEVKLNINGTHPVRIPKYASKLAKEASNRENPNSAWSNQNNIYAIANPSNIQVNPKNSRSLPISTMVHPNTIVLIERRSKRRRWLAQHTQIKALLTQIANDYNMMFEVFSDVPLPTLTQTISMFARARLVVAPHGAGTCIFKLFLCCILPILCLKIWRKLKFILHGYSVS